jgi:hypothetical protein
MTPLQALNERLAELRPASLLYLSARPALTLDDDTLPLTTRADVATVTGLAGEGRYDCALVADFLEHMSRADGHAVLARLRNLHAGRLLVFIDHAATRESWTLDDFLALGFRQDAQLSDAARTLTLYSYDIATYNHTREWNNPRFWANPEMWGKYFW